MELKFFRCPECGSEHNSTEMKERTPIKCGCGLEFWVIKVPGPREKVWIDSKGDVELPWYRVEDWRGNKLVTWEEQHYQ